MFGMAVGPRGRDGARAPWRSQSVGEGAPGGGAGGLVGPAIVPAGGVGFNAATRSKSLSRSARSAARRAVAAPGFAVTTRSTGGSVAARSLKHSRTRRLSRLRSVARFATRRPIASPSRGRAPGRAFTWAVNQSEWRRTPVKAASNSGFASRRAARGKPAPLPRVRGAAGPGALATIRESDACGPSRGGAQGPSDRPPWPCGRGSRGYGPS